MSTLVWSMAVLVATLAKYLFPRRIIKTTSVQGKYLTVLANAEIATCDEMACRIRNMFVTTVSSQFPI